MSVVETSRYKVVEIKGSTPFRFQLIDCAPAFSIRVDAFRTRHSAECAARSLNNGFAHLDPHAIVGCRVVAAHV